MRLIAPDPFGHSHRRSCSSEAEGGESIDSYNPAYIAFLRQHLGFFPGLVPNLDKLLSVLKPEEILFLAFRFPRDANMFKLPLKKIKDMIKEVMAKEEENRYKPPVEGCEDLSMTEEERKKLLEAFSFLWDHKTISKSSCGMM